MGWYILSGCNGKDLTKEFYGLVPKIYENQLENYVEAHIFSHQKGVLQLLNQMVIGEIETQFYELKDQ